MPFFYFQISPPPAVPVPMPVPAPPLPPVCDKSGKKAGTGPGTAGGKTSFSKIDERPIIIRFGTICRLVCQDAEGPSLAF